MFRPSRLGMAVVTTIVLAACGSERPAARERAPERTLTTAQDLSATNLFGSSLPAKTIALTFDDGPGDRAAELSSYLAGQGIRATFFVNGGRIASTALPNPNGLSPSANAARVLAQIAADGHLVANHTTTHRDLVSEVLPTGTANVVQELAETDADIAAYVPSSRFLFRAPYGSFDQNVWAALAPSAMNKYVGPIFWDIGGSASNYPAGAADWACWQEKLQSGGGGAYFGATTTDCGDAYLDEIYAVGRGIVLMHDPYSSALGNTVDMIKYIVPILKAKGYAFARVDEIPAIAALLPADSPRDGGSDASAEEIPDAAVTEDGGDVDPGLVSADAAVTKTNRTHHDGAGSGDGRGGGCTIGRSSSPRDGANLAIALGALALALIRRRQHS